MRKIVSEGCRRPGPLAVAAALAGLVLVHSCATGNATRSPLEGPPAEVDLWPRFEEAGLETRVQGGRPTCSVFAFAGALEYALARRGEPGARLSVEFLGWASNRACGEVADGSYFSDLWRGFELHGVCDEADFPYGDVFDPAREPSEEVRRLAAERRELELCLHWIKEWDVTTGLTDDELAGIKDALASGWPVAGGLRWPVAAHWTDGVLDMAPPEGVRDGHSVLLVGYRDDPAQPGGGVFLIRNSGSGSRGGALSYEYVAAYLNDAVRIGFDERRG